MTVLINALLLSVIGWLIYRLNAATRALREKAALATARAERLNTFFSTAVDGMIVITDKGEIEEFNKGAERLFGYAEADVRGRNVSMLMPAPYHDAHDGYIKRYLDTGEARIIGTGRQVSGLRRDGTTFPLHLSVGEMTINGERRFTGIVHDLTARMQLEQDLREQASLARLGEMAAVIAHDVKNPLAGIRGAIQVIGGRMPPNQGDYGMIKEIINRIDALDGMMKDLLLFARPPKPKRIAIELLPLLHATAALLREDAAFRDVEIAIEGSAPLVLADSEMLRMVFHNLLLNAAHAMQGRGRVSVSVSGVGTMCRITVADTGSGIAPEVIEKVFTPFFTTKARGTGLGLPTARRFVEVHGGQIAIACPPSGGTTVTVELPAVGAHP